MLTYSDNVIVTVSDNYDEVTDTIPRGCNAMIGAEIKPETSVCLHLTPNNVMGY